MSFPTNVTCLQVSSQMLNCNGTQYTLGDHLDHTDTTQFYLDIGTVCGLVILAGLMSGLTMGLMSMDKLNLKILVNGTDEKSKKYASRILPLVERHHLLLVTLLLSNAACAEALPIFLDRLVHPAIALVLSVTLVLMFGEIIPQAVCTRYGLKVGAYLAWFVWIMIVLLSPVAWPIAKLLDVVLGKETGTFFRRAELKELVHLHGEDENAAEGESLTIDEVRIIKGAIDMKEKTVSQAYTPIDKVFGIDINSNLSRDVLQQIVDSGHDRIPIYHNSREHFIGMILVKDLVLIDPNANTPTRDIKMYRVPMVGADMHLYDMLHQFQSGKSHMSIVLDANDHITPEGIITLEDVMEELLQEEIYDEDDIRRQDAANGEQPYNNVVHDMRLARAFMPRKYSVAVGAGAADPRRKYSIMMQGSPGAQNSADLRRRPTVAGTSLNNVGSIPSHILNINTAPRHSVANFAAGHPARPSSHPSHPPAYPPNSNTVTPYPPYPPHVPHMHVPPVTNNNNVNNSEQTPLLPPPGGKPAN